MQPRVFSEIFYNEINIGAQATDDFFMYNNNYNFFNDMLKKQHLPFLLAGLLSFSSFAAMRPQTGTVFELDGIQYAIIEDESPMATVVKPTSHEADMIFIPETVVYGGINYTVTQIERSAFESLPNLFLVELPGTITDIGNYAFYDCSLLNIETLPSNLLTIGDYAFAKMPNLKKVTLPHSTESIGIGAFSENNSLERAILFSEVTTLPANAFAKCPVLREVYLPEGLTELGKDCFQEDYNIAELILPPGLKRIYKGAIPGYAPSQKGLKNLVIPNSVEFIENGCFSSTDMISVELGDGIEEIPESAFYGCYDLKDVKLPVNLKKIGKSAFYSCGSNASRSLTKVEIPSTVTEICENAFAESRILSISTGDGITTLTKGSLGIPRSVHLGALIRSIDSDAMDMQDLVFITCDAATPPTVTTDFHITAEKAAKVNLIVKDEAKELYEKHPRWNIFNIVGASESMVEVTLNGTKGLAEEIYTISGQMPSRISSLKVHGTLSENDIRIITENMYSLTELDLGDTDMDEIPYKMFYGFKNLTKMVLPQHLKRVGESAFSGCSSMQISELPSTLESVAYEAFLDCASITIEQLPEALTYIGYRAFNGCSSIKRIVANERLEHMGIAAFGTCDLLEFADFGNCRVKEMDYTFYICYNLKTVVLPERLERLMGRTLSCTSVESVEIPGTVRELGSEVFYNSPLRVLSLGERLTKIPSGFLSEASNIVSLSLPSSLQSVGTAIMPNSSRLRALSCRAIEAPKADSGAFDGVQTQKCTLTVPSQSFFSYLNAPQWGSFGHLENTLDIDINGSGDVTLLPEDEYENILENEEAKEAVNEYGEGAAGQAYRRARKKQISNLTDGRLYASLFDGAQLNSDSNKKGYRVFFNNIDLNDIVSITLNNEDITSQMEGNSVLLPSKASGQLVINMKTSTANIVEVENNGAETVWYTLSGLPLGKRPLIPGIYVCRQGEKTCKVIIK